jgi:hypothetical protein
MASPTVNTLYTVVVTSANGCSASDDVYVTVNPLPNADAGPDNTICFGSITTLTASPAGMTYHWSTGATTQNIQVVGGDTTTYYVTVTNSFGCSATDSVTIASWQLPTAVASFNQTICSGELAAISAIGAGPGGSYSWVSNPPGFTATGASHVVQPSDTTTYMVTVLDINGCTDIDMITINVNPKPVVNLGPDLEICENYTVTLDAGSTFDNYLWSTGQTTQSINVNASNLTIGIHTFSVTVTLNGCATEDFIDIDVVPCPGIEEVDSRTIDINVYPNPSDGHFTVAIKGFDKDVEMEILNLMGQTIDRTRLDNSNKATFSRSFDLSGQPSGIYFLRFTDGDIVRTKKIIIE